MTKVSGTMVPPQQACLGCLARDVRFTGESGR